ncbi:MAG: class I SAM-dependent methyltransferase [Gammaproteobacteria bacterium]
MFYRLRQVLSQWSVHCQAALSLLDPRPKVAPDGLPLPPAGLRHLVAGTDDEKWFLRGGQAAVADFVSRVHGLERARVLDFGCGCGRVARAWNGRANISLSGVDTNSLAVRWCRKRLRFGDFRECSPAAPLPFPDCEFDFAYALSVLTHLSVPLQESSLRELARVLKPTGILAVSLHGSASARGLPLNLRNDFESGSIVVAVHGPQGSNLVSSFHPFERAMELFSKHFALDSFEESGASGNPPQDLYFLRPRPVVA